MKVLHVLDHSLPLISGYSIRSDYILRAQRRLGIDPLAVTSPKHGDCPGELETINGIEYHRTDWPVFSLSSRLKSVSMFRQMATLASLSRTIAVLAMEHKVDLIHAHSPSLNGMAAARASKETGLPWLYDLHYYDEDAAVDRGKTRYNSLKYRTSRKLEQSVLEEAAKIAVISEALRDDLIRRGIPPAKIFVVPNGVDADFFQPVPPDADLTEQYGLKEKLTAGFIGSFYSYEGLEYLVDAMIILMKKRADLRLMLVGEGECEAALRQSIPADLQDGFIFAGKVDHDQIRRYYSVMDVLVYPRISSRLTELTTPLKPLEAMAMGKAVIASDVGGMRELIRDGVTGCLVQPASPRLLAQSLERVLDDPMSRAELSRNARDYALEERDWNTITGQYSGIYRSLLNERVKQQPL